ncbi:plasmid mobilization protein [Campylobacter sp. MIT 97-5078]|uniref:plasmid mobilization protein n=1 Tax=Campylobacter sp. MIT 97-5078 TaxID=1548153 RepID=UPI000512FF84|nr:hypothetical protein [Campylobacter sp. MIT 97-5078]KGI55177.1 hypothetical protein LR59_13090 [Campylobacter sp. MIT 97-5078]TQR27273.1 hypothetical protein DMB91_04550 [Campylobacter sp. MIT 97-5078]
MSVEPKDNAKAKKSFAFVEDKSMDTNKVPQSLDELIKDSRSKLAKKTNKKNNKNTGIYIYLTEEQKELLRSKAKKANLPMSNYILIKLFGLE